MTLRRTLGLSLALLVISAGAMAKTAPAAPHVKQHNVKSKTGKSKVVRGKATRAKSSKAIASRKSAPEMRFSHATAAHLRHAAVLHHHAGLHHRAVFHHRLTSHTRLPVHRAALVEPVGEREIGRASWYGGRHVGMRTASGAILDRTHPTVAHRTLPLDTLVRVTNLKNGRSVIAVVNDRGPVSREFLVDLSPDAAEQLAMKHDGVVPVSVQPIATQSAELR